MARDGGPADARAHKRQFRADVGAGASVPPPDTAQAGDDADAHMGRSGSANGNAMERMNADGVEMKQSGGADLESAGTATVKGKLKR